MIVYSVMHSGSMFTLRLLTKWGLALDLHHTDTPAPDGPLLVPVRDPMLSARVTGFDDVDVREWLKIATLADRPDTHFLHVDQPRPDEAERLAAFLGVPVQPVDWGKKVWPRIDPTDAKGRYARGEVPDEMRDAYDWLTGLEAQPVRDLFASLGYSLPWMVA